MEFFHNPNFDWIGRKWYFIGASFLLSAVGLVSLIAKGGPRYGIDFKGGTMVHVKFREAPSLDRVRAALNSQGLGNSTLQKYGGETSNEVLIGLDLEAANERDLETGKQKIITALRKEFGGGDKPNFNEASARTIADQLTAAEQLRSSNLSASQAQQLAQSLVDFRD